MRPVSVEELFLENGQIPFGVLPDLEPLSTAALKDVNVLYTNDFAPGFDGLLDVKWYSAHGIDGVLMDHELCKLVITLIKYYEHVQHVHIDPETDFANRDRMKALECKVVWQLLCLVREGSNGNVNGESGTVRHEREEVMNRLEVIEALLTNRILSYNPLLSLKYDVAITPEKRKENEFWKLVGQYLTMPQDGDNTLWIVLMQIRELLDGAENRDVIYSALISRYFCDRIIGFPDHFPKNKAAGEEDAVNKAHIAKSFLKMQAQFQGTNHPIQRICHMAVSSWGYR
jgi:white-opaque regulator 2